MTQGWTDEDRADYVANLHGALDDARRDLAEANRAIEALRHGHPSVWIGAELEKTRKTFMLELNHLSREVQSMSGRVNALLPKLEEATEHMESIVAEIEFTRSRQRKEPRWWKRWVWREAGNE